MLSMSAQDATFLHVENDVTPMHIGGVSIFEGPRPSFDELLEMVAGKLHRTPRYRQKVRFVPLGVSEPVAIFSYDGGLYFGVTGARAACWALASAAGWSSPIRTFRSSARSVSWWRSSPTTAGFTSASPATAITTGTSTSSPRASNRG